MLLTSGNQVSADSVADALPSSGITPGSFARSSGSLVERVQDFERQAIIAELKRNNFHITNTAKALGLERSHLYKKAEQLGIDIAKHRSDEDR